VRGRWGADGAIGLTACPEDQDFCRRLSSSCPLWVSHRSDSVPCPPSWNNTSTPRSLSCGGVLTSSCFPSFRIHGGALSELIQCSILESSSSDKTGPHPTLPSAWDSNASVVALGTFSCINEFEANGALSGVKCIFHGRQRFLSLVHLNVGRSGCAGVDTVSRFRPFSHFDLGAASSCSPVCARQTRDDAV